MKDYEKEMLEEIFSQHGVHYDDQDDLHNLCKDIIDGLKNSMDADREIESYATGWTPGDNERDKQKVKKLRETIWEKDQEISSLNVVLEGKDNNIDFLKQYIKKLEDELDLL